MDKKKDSDSKLSFTKKIDLKYGLMDKALGFKQVLPKTKKTIKSSSFIQSLSKPIPKNKPKPELKQKVVKKENQKKDSANSMVFVGAIVLIVIVALFFVLNLNIGLEGKNADEQKNKAGEENKENGINNNGGLSNLSFKERYAKCIIELNVERKDKCIEILALEFNNDVLCDELVNIDSEKCKRDVWKANAIVSEELDKCKELLTEVDKIDCVKQIALNTADQKMCVNITEVSLLASTTEINSCLIELAMQEKDLTVCDEIDGSMQNTCKFSTVITISNADLCVIFELPTIKQDCISRIAKNNNDIALCNRITNSIQKNKCINDLT